MEGQSRVSDQVHGISTLKVSLIKLEHVVCRKRLKTVTRLAKFSVLGWSIRRAFVQNVEVLPVFFRKSPYGSIKSIMLGSYFHYKNE